MKCFNRLNNGKWAQEIYETASGYAAIRSKQLRDLGYIVSVSCVRCYQNQVKKTLVDIRPGCHEGTYNLPETK